MLVKLTEDAKEWLARNGFDARYGARPMSRLIHDRIKQPLASEILFGKLSDGGSVSVDVENDTISLIQENSKQPADVEL